MAFKISLVDIKNALKDGRFRDSLPLSFQDEVAKFISNPGCSCNVQLYKKILKEAKVQLMTYFPDKTIEEEIALEQPPVELQKNNFTVINCHIDELESKLKTLPIGRKQLAMSRYDTQITVIVNELDELHHKK